MTFWSGNKIETAFAASPRIVDPFDPAKIDCSSYRLSLGEQYFITPDHDVKMRDSVRKSLAAPVNQTGGGPVSIPPGQFAFLLTEESLTMPDTAMGFISMRAGFKLNGLINVSGFHVDPGFKGKLVFAVYNAGPATVSLSRGEPLFLLWLADLDASATDKFSRKKKLPQLEIPNDVISKVNYQIHALQNLSKKIDALDSSLQLIRNTGGAIAVVLAIAFAAFKFWPDGGEPLNSSSNAQEMISSPNPIRGETNATGLPPAEGRSDAAPAQVGASVPR